MARPNKISPGRTPKLQPLATAWLKAYLSGGAKSAKEIQFVGERQGFGWRTIKVCKLQLGFESYRKGTVWFWRDPSIEETPPAPTPTVEEIEARLKNRLEEAVQKRFSDLAVDFAPAADSDAVSSGGIETWSEEDYEQSSLSEIVDYGSELSEDLREAERYHGKMTEYDDEREEILIDNSPTIKRLQKQIQRTTGWIAKKSSHDQPAGQS